MAVVKERDVADVIRRDLLRTTDAPTVDVTKCYSCGHSMLARRGRFCSDRCRDWYDAGRPSFDEQRERQRQDITRRIQCQGCQREFESRGLHCCSIECDRLYREREDNRQVMAEVGIEPAAKRHCEGPNCSATIPKWRRGRRVSRATRFCSSKCARRARIAKIA
jgi:hypothetical protein